jgi:hypothetical protein
MQPSHAVHAAPPGQQIDAAAVARLARQATTHCLTG